MTGNHRHAKAGAGERERGGLGNVEATKLDGHQHGGHPVIRDVDDDEFTNKMLNLAQREGLPSHLDSTNGTKFIVTPNWLHAYSKSPELAQKLSGTPDCIEKQN